MKRRCPTIAILLLSGLILAQDIGGAIGSADQSTAYPSWTTGVPPGINAANPQDLTNRSNPQDMTLPGASNPQDLVR